MSDEILQLPRLLQRLSGFVEPLQGKQAVGEINVWGATSRLKAKAFTTFLRRLLALSLLEVRIAQVEMCSVVLRIAGSPLLIGLCGFLQFPGHIVVIVSGNSRRQHRQSIFASRPASFRIVLLPMAASGSCQTGKRTQKENMRLKRLVAELSLENAQCALYGLGPN